MGTNLCHSKNWHSSVGLVGKSWMNWMCIDSILKAPAGTICTETSVGFESECFFSGVSNNKEPTRVNWMNHYSLLLFEITVHKYR